MPIVYIGILRTSSKPAVDLCVEKNVKPVGRWYAKGNISEFLDFFAHLYAERVKPGERKRFDKDDDGNDLEWCYYTCPYEGGVCGVVVADRNYPNRVAQAILSKSLEAFAARYPQSAYADLQPAPKGSPPPLALPEIKDYIDKYQNPENIDPIIKIQMELEETKVFMSSAIGASLERGEKLEALVAKSDNLSAQSKMFYTQAKKQNSCCVIM